MDLEAQSRQSRRAMSNLIERITPWLFTFGSWIFGGLIAFSLWFLASLTALGPGHVPTLVALTAFACALPLNVTGLFLLRLTKELKDAGIDEQTRQAYQEVGFPLETYLPQEMQSLYSKKRASVALRYAISTLVLSIVLTLAGTTAALWYVAWWLGVTFLAVVLFSPLLFTLVTVLSPTSEEEKQLKRRYKEQIALSSKLLAEQKKLQSTATLLQNSANPSGPSGDGIQK